MLAKVAAALGLPMMPWQQLVLDIAHEIDPGTGWWAYDEVVVTVPRQAGKTTLLIPVYAHRLATLVRGSLWMTAQAGKKARKRWMDAGDQLLLPTSPIRPRLKRMVSIGHEELRHLDTASVLLPFAPNETDMHGESPDAAFVDEWWAFDQVAADGLVQAYSPGFLTKNAQAWKTSTAGTERSAGLNADVAKGRTAVELGRLSGTAYFEWSLPDELEVGGEMVVLEEVPDDVLVAAALEIHPAIGFHPTAPAQRMREHIAKDFAKLGRAGFIRAYGNRNAKAQGGWRVIDQASWAAAMAARAIPPGVPVGLAFEVDPEGREAAIAAAWRGPDGRAVAELLRCDPGMAWVTDAMVALSLVNDHVQVMVNNAGPARDEADRVERAGVPVERVNQLDYAAACARVLKEIGAKPRPTLQHIGQPQLTTAAEHAGRRSMGRAGAWAWAAGDEYPAAALVAVTLAVWAVDHPRETEPELGEFWIA